MLWSCRYYTPMRCIYKNTRSQWVGLRLPMTRRCHFSDWCSLRQLAPKFGRIFGPRAWPRFLMPHFGQKKGFRARMNEIKSGIPCSAFSDWCVCIFVKQLQDGLTKTHARNYMPMRCLFSDWCVCIFVKRLHDGLTKTHAHDAMPMRCLFRIDAFGFL